MKTKHLKIGIVTCLFLSIVGCKDCNECEKDLEKRKSELIETHESLEKCEYIFSEIKAMNSLLYPTPENGDISQTYHNIKDIQNQSNSNTNASRRYEAYGKFILANDKVEVSIPITEKKLKIVNYKNISSGDINCLLIVLNGNNGMQTDLTPIVGVIQKTFSINSLGLDRNELQKDKELKVIIFHDDNYINLHAENFQKCIDSLSDYKWDSCLDVNNIIPYKEGKAYTLPKETGGGILTGG